MEKLISDEIENFLKSPHEVMKDINEQVKNGIDNPYVEFKVQEASGYDSQFQLGWEILCLFDGETITFGSHQEQDVNNINYNNPICLDRPFKVKTNYFLMGQRKNNAVLELKGRVEHIENKFRTIESNIRERDNKLTTLENEKNTLADSLKLSKAVNEKDAETHKDMRDRFLLLEGDLSKFKSAIGEIKYNEIIGNE